MSKLHPYTLKTQISSSKWMKLRNIRRAQVWLWAQGRPRISHSQTLWSLKISITIRRIAAKKLRIFLKTRFSILLTTYLSTSQRLIMHLWKKEIKKRWERLILLNFMSKKVSSFNKLIINVWERIVNSSRHLNVLIKSAHLCGQKKSKRWSPTNSVWRNSKFISGAGTKIRSEGCLKAEKSKSLSL